MVSDPSGYEVQECNAALAMLNLFPQMSSRAKFPQSLIEAKTVTMIFPLKSVVACSSLAMEAM